MYMLAEGFAAIFELPACGKKAAATRFSHIFGYLLTISIIFPAFTFIQSGTVQKVDLHCFLRPPVLAMIQIYSN
jgi:hypothetical protein